MAALKWQASVEDSAIYLECLVLKIQVVNFAIGKEKCNSDSL